MQYDRRQFVISSLAAMVWPGAASPQDPPPTVVYICPMHPDVQSKVPGTCQKCNMKLVAGKAGTDSFYVCPMHPDVIASEAGNCPKCRMKLVKAAPPELSEYFVRIEPRPSPPRAGQTVTLRFTVFHPETAKQITSFNILHDMPFHLFVVSQDFESFQHIHPELQKDGSFLIETMLPKPGYYKIFCDFFPAGGLPQVTHHHLVTAGYRGDLISSQARLRPESPVDGRLVRTVDGTRFELNFEPTPVYSGEEFRLHYRIFDELTGAPVDDLRPYLAAWGHTLILSEDGTDYLHSHPTEMLPEGMTEEERARLRGGSEVVFDTFFPRPGRYRIWSQFQRRDRIITVPFTIEVPRLG